MNFSSLGSNKQIQCVCMDSIGNPGCPKRFINRILHISVINLFSGLNQMSQMLTCNKITYSNDVLSHTFDFGFD